ncbi:MAG TPA: MarR family transcriptional regulator [Gammaproteobacteria bacterium]|jgi:DNA-binding MarR family transcriptional regulator
MATAGDTTGVGYLLVDVSRLLRRDFDRRVRGLALTQVQWRAIAHLLREEGINQTVLAERLEVAPITLGRLIDRLEAAGWVRREADPADRRASLLFLTQKAGPIVDQMRAHASEALDAAMAGLPSAARRQLVKALERIKENLAAADAAANASEGTYTYGRRKEPQRRRAG